MTSFTVSGTGSAAGVVPAKSPRWTSRRSSSSTNSGFPSVVRSIDFTSSGSGVRPEKRVTSSPICVAIERDERQEGSLARDVTESLPHLGGELRFFRPVRADNQRPQSTQVPRDEMEQRQRGRVRHVQIVQHQNQRPQSARRLQDRRDRVEQAKPRLRRIAFRSRCNRRRRRAPGPAAPPSSAAAPADALSSSRGKSRDSSRRI